MCVCSINSKSNILSVIVGYDICQQYKDHDGKYLRSYVLADQKKKLWAMQGLEKQLLLYIRLFAKIYELCICRFKMCAAYVYAFVSTYMGWGVVLTCVQTCAHACGGSL